MNATAILWAEAQTSLSILEKSILLHLAVLADEAFQVRHSSQRVLAKFIGCSREAINKALGSLRTRGLIVIKHQFDVDGTQLPSVYGLSVPRTTARAAKC